jgi:uncharacterized protein
LKLDITSIIKNSGGIISIQVEEALEDLKTSLGTVSFISPVSFTGDVTNNNGILKLTGVAKVIYSTVCDRCAESIERELVVDINEDIIEKEKIDEEAVEIFDDDRFTFSGNSLDLDRVLADCILTSIPMTQVCREDCPGLCPVCGAKISEKACKCEDNGSTDSRFEVLKGFLINNE